MTQQSVLVAKNNSYDKSINDERLKLITYDYTLDHVNMTDNHAQFVDKDNYNAFLKIKTKSGFFKRIIYNYGIYIYILLLLYCILSQFIDVLPTMNWVILLFPLFLYTMFFSFNSFSSIKISF